MPAFHVFSENVLELANNKSECRSQKHSAINCNFIQLHLQKVEFMKREETSNPESHSFLKAANISISWFYNYFGVFVGIERVQKWPASLMLCHLFIASNVKYCSAAARAVVVLV